MYTTVDLDQVFAAMTENKATLREFGRLAAAELSQG
jgi:uncharacterized protein YutE (UPF0331/DUF86 family)